MTSYRVLAWDRLDRYTKKRLWKLLKRYDGRIEGIVVIVRIDKPRQASALAANYQAKVLKIDLRMLLEGTES